MTDEQSSAVEQFFAAVEHLKSLRVIRSDKYLGDIAEFICKDQFGLELAASGRQRGYDGHIEGQKVQVNFSGGTSTTIDCGDPDQYDELVIILGPKSVLRRELNPKEFTVYRIPSAVVKQRAPHDDKARRYSKTQLPAEYLVQAKK